MCKVEFTPEQMNRIDTMNMASKIILDKTFNLEIDAETALMALDEITDKMYPGFPF